MAQAAQGVRELFAAGRRAAHEAMGELGLESAPIIRSPSRAPLWPSAIVGSISHTSGLAMAVVGWKKDCAGVGIDVEKVSRRPSLSLASKVACAKESLWIDEPMLESPQNKLSQSSEFQGLTNSKTTEFASFRLLRLLSAKEAVFKTFFPLNNIYLGFCEAQLWPELWGFRGQLLKTCAKNAPCGLTFHVRQTVEDGYLLSACCLPQSC